MINNNEQVLRFSDKFDFCVNDLQVLEWMSDAGIQPSNQMYRDIVSFGERSAGIEFEPLIRQKIGEMNTS